MHVLGARVAAAEVFDGRSSTDRLCTAAAAGGWVVLMFHLSQMVYLRGFS